MSTRPDLPRLAAELVANLDALAPGAADADRVELTIEQAYELQSRVSRLREQRGEKLVGYKVGCTSRTIQKQLGVDGPIFGRVFDTGRFYSPAQISLTRHCDLAVEGELAVRLCNDLSGEGLSDEDCGDATGAVFPVIELHHYRIPTTWAARQWLIASNGMHAGFVQPDTEVPFADGKGLSYRLRIQIVGGTAESVEDSACGVRPLESVGWLAGKLAQVGLKLCAGQVVLTGSPMNLFPVCARSQILVECPPWGTSCARIVR